MRRILTLICALSILLTFSGCRKSTVDDTMFSYVESGKQTVSVIENTIISEGSLNGVSSDTVIIETESSNNGVGNSSQNNESMSNESGSSKDESTSSKGEIAEDTEDLVLSDEELEYKPKSLTVSLYDLQKSIYGFTFNTDKEPIKPVVQIKKQGQKSWIEYSLSSVKTMTFNSDWSIYYYYVSKTEIKLDANSTYIYRVCDTGAEKKYGKYIGTEETTLKTKNTKSNSFTFAHISDTQRGSVQFGQVLSLVTDKSDFLLHTGDIIQNPIETDWIDMIDGNFKYLSRIPMMAIAGNHEVNGGFKNNDIYRHFNNSIPTQTSTASGYFYSFIYGNAKFIMLNTNDLKNNQLSDEQYNWLVNELESNSCKWVIVSLHNPLYSVGEWGSTNNTIALALQNQLKGIFAEYGVDVVLQGHDHTISRTFPINKEGLPQKETVEKSNGVEYSVDPNGVIYLTNGTSGSVTREPENYDKTLYKYAAASNEATWSEISVDGDKLTVVVKHYDGGKETVYYKWGIKKS